MFLNQLEMQRYIQASAKRADLTVVWKEGVFPHVRGRTIFLPKLNAGATERQYRQLLHYAVHESDHVLYTDYEGYPKYGTPPLKSFTGFAWNVLEDHRIEWKGGREYEGDRLNADYVLSDIWTKPLEALKEVAKDPEKQELFDRLLPLMAFQLEVNADMYPSAAGVQRELKQHLSPKGEERLNKLLDGDYAEVLRNFRSTDDNVEGTRKCWDLAQRIVKEVFEWEEPKPEEQPQEGGGNDGKPTQKDNGNGEKGKGGKSKAKPEKKEQGDDDGGGDDKSEADKGGDDAAGDDGDGEQSDDAKDDSNGADKSGSGGGAGKIAESEQSPSDSKGHDEMVEVNYQEFSPMPHAPTAPEDRPSADQQGEGMHINYDDYNGSGSYVPATVDEIDVADYARNRFSAPKLAVQAENENLKEYYQRAVTPGGAGFASRVRQKLQIRSKDKFEYGVKRGHLHQSSLYRATIKDAPGINERVFKRKIVSDTLDTCVQVVVDSSGSMLGDKYGHAMVSAELLNEAIGNVLAMPLEIVGFTDGHTLTARRNPLMYVHRDFDTKRLPKENLIERMSKVALASNPDGDCINWAYDRIRRRREKRKVMIVLSDGQPSCSRPGDICWYTEKVVKQIHDSKAVEIVGIGIMDMSVKGIYPEHYVINDAGELEQALLKLIDKKVR